MVTDDSTDLAAAWVKAWRALGGEIIARANGGPMVWFPLTVSNDHGLATRAMPLASPEARRSGRTALLALLDTAGTSARDAVFAHALDARES